MANQMRLTLQLNAVDNMSRIVQSAAMSSKRSLDSIAANSQKRAAQARSAMFESGMLATAGAAALAFPIKMAANYEMLRIRMIALTKSQSEGMRLYGQTVKLASETPLTLDQVATATTRLIGFGRSAQQAIVDVKMLGDVVTLAGGDIDAAMVAYGQAAGEGRVMTRDLTQFVNAGVPIFKMLGEVTGANGAELKKMAEQGQLSFAILEEAFRKSTSAGGQFADGMKVMSGAAMGIWPRFTDEVGRFAAVFGDALLPSLKEFGEWIIPIITDTGEWFRNHQTLTTIIGGSVVYFTLLSGATFLYSAGIWAVNTAMISNIGTANMFILKHLGALSVLKWMGRRLFFLRFAFFATGEAGVFMTNVMNIGLVPAIGKVIMGLNGIIATNLGLSASIYGIPLVGWILAAISGLVAMIAYWDEWGAALGALILGPISGIIGAFIEIKRNWSSIVSAFSNDGLLRGFMRLADVVMSGLVYPLQKLLEVIGNVTGADWAKSAAKGLLTFRSEELRTVTESVSRSKSSGIASNGAGLIGPSATAQLAGSRSNSNSATVNYSPTITIGSGVSKEDKESFTALLERHKLDLARMVGEVTRSDARKQFNTA